MCFFKALLVGASLVVATIAQQQLQFTPIPNITVGERNVDIAWIGGDGTSPITITLRNGPAGNLANVSTLADGVTGLGNNYYWNVPSSLSAGEYALFIAQGNEYNYSPRFQITGSSSSSSSASSTSASSTDSASSIDSASGTAAPSSTDSGINGIGVLPPVSASSVSSLIASINGTLSSLAFNLTSSMPITAAAGASGAGVSGAAGTGIPIARNTTLSSATLTAASSTDTATSTATDTSGASSSSAGVSSGSVGSGTAGSSTASSTKSASSAAAPRVAWASPLAFVISAVAAILYLN